MKVLHKKNQGKSIRNEGGYSGEVGHNIGQNLRIFKELQNDSRSLLDEVRALPG